MDEFFLYFGSIVSTTHIEKINFKKLLTKISFYCIIYLLSGNMREWRNWQTRTFEGRVVYTVRVQVPFLAPYEDNKKDIVRENPDFIGVFAFLKAFFASTNP